MAELKSEPLWHVRQGGLHIGPIPQGQMQKFIEHGFVSPEDEVSRDAQRWEYVHGVPELLTDEYLALRVCTWKPEPCSKPQPTPRKLSLSTNLLILTWVCLISVLVFL